MKRKMSSVTKFDERQVNNLCQTLNGLFNVWQHFEPILANRYVFGHIFIVVNGKILKNNLAIWSHCVNEKYKQTQVDRDAQKNTLDWSWREEKWTNEMQLKNIIKKHWTRSKYLPLPIDEQQKAHKQRVVKVVKQVYKSKLGNISFGQSHNTFRFGYCNKSLILFYALNESLQLRVVHGHQDSDSLWHS